ncbi:MAG: PDZ domain-containing protein [Armatimonadetes bacterium]|nr:PDZ domain-containing protein [Armatimonadota bacterium]
MTHGLAYSLFMAHPLRWLAGPIAVLTTLAPLTAFAQFKNGDELVKKNVEFTQDVREEILKGVTDILENRAFVPNVDFKKWDGELAKSHDDLVKLDTENAFTNGVNKLLREFGITHIGLRTPKSAEFRRTGTTSGLGMSAQFKDGAMVVQSVTEGSPAAQAGLQVGDKIVEINGEPVKEDSKLSADGEQPLQIKFVRGMDDAKEVSIKSGSFVAPPRADTLTWLGDDIAMIRINSFSRGYEIENINKMMSEAAKAKGVIVDLRNNGGGAVSNLAHLMGLFIDSNEAVGTFVNRQMMAGYLKEKNLETATVNEIAAWGTSKFRPRAPSIPRYEGRVAVLINRGSASASEIFSAAMKDVRGAEIVGQPSRGAVLASVYGRLAGGFEIQYPISDYVTIKGVRLEGNPVTPTLAVEAGRGQDGDAVLEAAVQALRSPISSRLF